MKKLYIYTYLLISRNEMNIKKRRGKKNERNDIQNKGSKKRQKNERNDTQNKGSKKREKKGIMCKIKIILEYLIPLINLILNFIPVFLS